MSARLHRVRVDSFALAELLESHRRAADREPCAILVGRSSPTGVDILACWAVENAHSDPTRAFLLPSKDVAAAQAKARERGLDVVGTWHGHLKGDARLSGADTAGLLSASVAPGTDGIPAARPHAFLVSGRSPTGSVIVRAYIAAADRSSAEVPLKILPPD